MLRGGQGGSFWHPAPRTACSHSERVHLHNCIFHEVFGQCPIHTGETSALGLFPVAGSVAESLSPESLYHLYGSTLFEAARYQQRGIVRDCGRWTATAVLIGQSGF